MKCLSKKLTKTRLFLIPLFCIFVGGFSAVNGASTEFEVSFEYRVLSSLNNENGNEEIKAYPNQIYSKAFLNSTPSNETLSKCKKNSVLAAGWVFGIVSAVCMVNLGEDFWERVFSHSKAEALTLDCLSVIPLFFLYAKTTGDTFLDIVKEMGKGRTYSKNLCTTITLFVGKFISTSIMAAGPTYLTYNYYNPEIKEYCFFLVIPTFISQSALGFFSIDGNIQTLKTFFRKCKIKLLASAIEKKREKILNILENIRKELCAGHINVNNFVEPYVIEGEDDIFLRINYVKQQSEFHPFRRESSSVRQFMGGLGWLTGQAGMWLIQPVIEQGIGSFIRAIGIEDDEFVSVFSKTTSCLGTFLTSIAAFTTKKVFESIYDNLSELICDKTYCKSLFLNSPAIFLAALSSTPRIEMGIQYFPEIMTLKPLLIICCGIGRTCIGYWAIKNFRNNNGKDAQNHSLIKFINDLKEDVRNFREDMINDLYEAIL
jgi:hypothetical protein